MKAVVTGASGFVGAPLARLLRARGHDVTPLSLRADDVESVLERVQPDHVFHLAWIARGDYLHARDNIDCLERSLRLLRALPRGARVSVAGTCLELDGLAPTLYATTKASLRSVALMLDLRLTWTRFFHLYGPREDERRLVSFVARAVREGRPAHLATTGAQVRDFLHVDDAARALADLPEGTFSVGTGRGVTVAEVARRTARLVGREDLVALGDRVDEPESLVADTTAAAAAGFVTAVSLDDGLASTIASLGTTPP